MGKRWLALGLTLLTVLSFAGCGAAEELSLGCWQRVEYLPETTAGAFLTALDLAPEEQAAADPAGLGLVWQMDFTPEGEYKKAVAIEETRALTRQYLDDVLRTLTADPAALAPLYDEAFGADMAAMDPEQARAFYAGLYGCADYETLLDHLTAALFDYEALAEAGESGKYSARGGKLFLTDGEGYDRGYVEFVLTADSLTLTYANATEEYSNTAR